MKLKPKQVKALENVSEFIPPWISDWGNRVVALNDNIIGLNSKESEDGVSAEEAFFMKTERGKLPEYVKDVPRLRALLWGQRWMAVEKSRKR